MRAQSRLDLTGLDPHPRIFSCRSARPVMEQAVGTPAGEIAREPERDTRPERVLDELLRPCPVVAEIAAAARRHRLQVLRLRRQGGAPVWQTTASSVPGRPPDRRVAVGCFRDSRGCKFRAVLGRSEPIHDPHTRQSLERAASEVRRKRLPLRTRTRRSEPARPGRARPPGAPPEGEGTRRSLVTRCSATADDEPRSVLPRRRRRRAQRLAERAEDLPGVIDECERGALGERRRRVAATLQAKRARSTSVRWLPTTPFGRPVLPDVKRT
jgi:hypothetical protein